MRKSSDSTMDLIRSLRQKSGIAPIPLTEAERRSGVLGLFEGPKRGGAKRGGAQNSAASDREWQLRDREAELQRREQDLFMREQSAQKKERLRKQELKKVTEVPRTATKPVEPLPAKLPDTASPREQSKQATPPNRPKPASRAAMFVAAYKKNQ